MSDAAVPHTKTSPLPAADHDRLHTLVAAVGERAAIDRVGCSRAALTRALAGLPIYRVTASAIRAALDAADRERPTPRRTGPRKT